MLPQLDLVRTLLPLGLFVLLSLLAYVKVAIVLQVLRRGLGGGVPPLLVTVLLGLTLATLSMSPLIKRSLANLSAAPPSASSSELIETGTAPLQQFLVDHTPARDKAQLQALTAKLAQRQGTIVEPNELPVLLSAFLLGELRTAFQLAFLLLLPFLVLDLLAALLLSGLQLGGLSLRTVTLPFKLLLFLVCDGFTLLFRGLLLGYS
jgi:flagellar biosynthesis protein FliP